MAKEVVLGGYLQMWVANETLHMYMRTLFPRFYAAVIDLEIDLPLFFYHRLIEILVVTYSSS